MPLSDLLIFTHLAATLFMTGLIWFVQVVHYPLMAQVPKPQFQAFQQAHVTRTTWVVGPPMLLEAACATGILLVPSATTPFYWSLMGFMLLVSIWVSTALFQVPAHHTLMDGFDRITHRSLVRSNWLRTFAWSTRSVVASLIVIAHV